MNRLSFRATAIYALALILLSPAHAEVPLPWVTELPYEYTGDAKTRNVPYLAWYRDLDYAGYVEKEIEQSGQANVYEYVDDESQSPAVQPSGETDFYTTRVLMRFPENPADFNGVVYLEILNATARRDGAPMWNLTFRSMMDEGAAWVGVTYADVAAQFLRYRWGRDISPAPAGSKKRNRSRYANLDIPTRAYMWDMLNQTAALLKTDDSPSNPMQGYGVNTIIATGYSQSASYVTTYANSFYPSYTAATCEEVEITAATVECEPIVDGYIVAAPGAQARRIDGASSHPVGDRRNCENTLNREAPCDIGEVESDDTNNPNLPKIIRFTTESDIKSVRVRQTQADQPNLRTYEVAGISHVDATGDSVGRRSALYSFGVDPGSIGTGCDFQLNSVAAGIPLGAAQHRLARWIQFDELPPDNHFIDFTGDFDEGTERWERDADGNVTGGVRPVRIEVPLGQYGQFNTYSGPTPSVLEIFCPGIIGSQVLFDSEEVESRYSDKETYQQLIWSASWTAFQEGFLLPSDAAWIIYAAGLYQGLPDSPPD